MKVIANHFCAESRTVIRQKTKQKLEISSSVQGKKAVIEKKKNEETAEARKMNRWWRDFKKVQTNIFFGFKFR